MADPIPYGILLDGAVVPQDVVPDLEAATDIARDLSENAPGKIAAVISRVPDRVGGWQQLFVVVLIDGEEIPVEDERYPGFIPS